MSQTHLVATPDKIACVSDGGVRIHSAELLTGVSVEQSADS